MLTRHSLALLDQRYAHNPSALAFVRFLINETGDEMPGFARLDPRQVMARGRGIKPCRLRELRSMVAIDAKTKMFGDQLFVWSPLAAHTVRKSSRWADWWGQLRYLESYHPRTPFLREVRAWLENARRTGNSAALECPPERHAEPQRFPTLPPFYAAPMSGGMSGGPTSGPRWSLPPSFPTLPIFPVALSRSAGLTSGDRWSNLQPFQALLIFPVAPLLNVEERSKSVTSRLGGASQDPENQHPPLSLDPRASRPCVESEAFPPPETSTEGGLNGFRGEREAPARALSDTVTADHVPGGSRVPSPSSETRLMAARANEEEDDVTREEQIEALRAIEAGEVQLPIAPTRPAPSPDGRPVRLGEVAPSGPATARARPRASGGTVTPGILKAALLAAMARHKPGWTFKGGVRNDEAIYELGRRYCANRTVEWLGYWLEEQVRRFVVDPRADGHQPTGLVLFLRVKGVTEPYIPEPEGKFPPLGSGDPPPVAELFAALDKASADMWTPRKVSEG